MMTARSFGTSPVRGKLTRFSAATAAVATRRVIKRVVVICENRFNRIPLMDYIDISYPHA